jgi:hypothetical protein
MAHIKLSERKRLASRIVFLESSRFAKIEFAQRNHVDDFEHLQRVAFQVGDRAADDSDNATPLDRIIRDIPNALAQHAIPLIKPAAIALAQATVERIRSGADRVDCHKCSPVSPKICDGGNADDLIVSSGGACLEPFKRMFDVAFSTAKRTYLDCCPNLRDEDIASVLFVTSFSQSKPHDLPIEVFVNGETLAGNGKDPNEVWVELIVSTSNFDWETYHCCPS